MDIAGLSMALSSVSVSNDVSTAILSMSLDNYQEMGEEMTKMMEKSVTPQLGQIYECK